MSQPMTTRRARGSRLLLGDREGLAAAIAAAKPTCPGRWGGDLRDGETCSKGHPGLDACGQSWCAHECVACSMYFQNTYLHHGIVMPPADEDDE